MQALLNMSKSNFDENYYNRFYFDENTRAVSPEEQTKQAAFIAAYLAYLQVPVQRVADIGCGIGNLLGALHQKFPNAHCTGVEYSDYLCARYGWSQGSVVNYSDTPFDLVVCNDVLGYLSKKQASKAIKNLAELTNSAVYISVLTREDLAICDTEHTDMQQKVRPYRWYKKRLDKYFVAVGGGLFLKKPLAYPLWRIEKATD